MLLALFAFDDYTGFKVTQLLELPQPWSIIIVWGIVLPSIFLAASALTNIVLKDALILKVLPPVSPVSFRAAGSDLLGSLGGMHWLCHAVPCQCDLRSRWQPCASPCQQSIAPLMQGPCPSCGTQASTYFGDILTVRGNREKNTVTCDNCKAKMDFLAPKRQVIIALILFSTLAAPAMKAEHFESPHAMHLQKKR